METPTGLYVAIIKPDGTYAAVTSSATNGEDGIGVVSLTLDMGNATTYPIGHYQVAYMGTVTTRKNVASFHDFVLSEYSLDDIAAKTDTIGSLEITVTSPIGVGGDIEVMQGQDLAVDLGTQIDFDITSGVILNKSWTSAAASLYFGDETLTGSISAISGGQRLRFIATAAVTALWSPAVYDYKAEIVFSDGEEYPVRGEMTVVEDIP